MSHVKYEQIAPTEFQASASEKMDSALEVCRAAAIEVHAAYIIVRTAIRGLSDVSQAMSAVRSAHSERLVAIASQCQSNPSPLPPALQPQQIKLKLEKFILQQIKTAKETLTNAQQTIGTDMGKPGEKCQNFFYQTGQFPVPCVLGQKASLVLSALQTLDSSANWYFESKQILECTEKVIDMQASIGNARRLEIEAQVQNGTVHIDLLKVIEQAKEGVRAAQSAAVFATIQVLQRISLSRCMLHALKHPKIADEVLITAHYKLNEAEQIASQENSKALANAGWVCKGFILPL